MNILLDFFIQFLDAMSNVQKIFIMQETIDVKNVILFARLALMGEQIGKITAFHA